jgi:hypothetical protein
MVKTKWTGLTGFFRIHRINNAQGYLSFMSAGNLQKQQHPTQRRKDAKKNMNACKKLFAP